MNKKKTAEQYVAEAKEVHGDLYDYSRLVYLGSNKKVEIICRIHGSFWTRAAGHLCGIGCGRCNRKRPLRKRGLKIDRTPNDRGKRICSTCRRELDISSFTKSSQTKDGYSSQCRECMLKVSREKENRTREHRKAMARERDKKRKIQYLLDHPDEVEQIRIKKEKFAIDKKNRERIVGNMRWRIRSALRWVSSRPHFRDLIGCSPEFLRLYLQSKFTDGMAWSNYGKKGWHVDHIRPVASFNMSNEAEVLECFHYSNLQPLWYADNIRKGSLYEGVRFSVNK